MYNTLGMLLQYSNAIGQGEVETTPIQLANFTAAIANKGYFYTPHILKKIDKNLLKTAIYREKTNNMIDKHFTHYRSNARGF